MIIPTFSHLRVRSRARVRVRTDAYPSPMSDAARGGSRGFVKIKSSSTPGQFGLLPLLRNLVKPTSIYRARWAPSFNEEASRFLDPDHPSSCSPRLRRFLPAAVYFCKHSRYGNDDCFDATRSRRSSNTVKRQNFQRSCAHAYDISLALLARSSLKKNPTPSTLQVSPDPYRLRGAQCRALIVAFL